MVRPLQFGNVRVMRWTILTVAIVPWLAFGDRPPTPLEALAAVPLPAARGNESIKGSVVSALGPVAGATVVAVRTDGPDLITRLRDPCPGPRTPAIELRCAASKRVLAEAARKRTGAASIAARATARADGTFTIEGLAPGGHALYAFGSGLVGLVTNVHPGGTPVEVEATTGIMLGGDLFREGKRTGAATVTAFHEAAPIFVSAVSGHDGSLRIGPLPEGTWFVVAEQAGALPDAKFVSEHWAPISGVSLSLDAPRRIEGTVRAGGKPAAGVRVVLPYVEDADHYLFERDGAHGGGHLGPDGRFEFRGLPSGRYAIDVAVSDPSGSRRKRREVTVNSGSLVDIGEIQPADRK